MSLQSTVDRVTDALNRHDAKAFVACYAPEAVVSDPQYKDPVRGTEAIGKDIEGLFTAFPDIAVTVLRTIGDDGSYAVEMAVRGTHTGPLEGPDGPIPATNRPLTFNAGVFGKLGAQGRILEEHRYYDLAGQFEQLGLAH